MTEKRNVLVIGAGTMGHSIAQVFAAQGYPTALVDQNSDQLATARKMIAGNMAVLQAEGAISDQQMQNVDRYLVYAQSLDEAAAQAGLVVEAIPEHPDYKKELFSRLDKLCPPDCILTSTTSVLNIYEFVEVSHPERLVIAHWCNPPHIIPLVEVVMGPRTSPATADTVKNILTDVGKVPVVLKECVLGFIVNRLNAALAREAGYMVSQGWVTPEDVDAAFSANAGLKAPFEGPLELMDYIGWDVGTAAGRFLYPSLCNSTEGMAFAEEMVAKGCLGIKSGRGIKDYTGKNREDLQNERNLKILKVVQLSKELKGREPLL